MTQCDRVLKVLQSTQGWVSTDVIEREAWTTRGPARVLDLKKKGHRIETGARNEHGFQTYRFIPKDTLF